MLFSGCASNLDFASLIGFPGRITSSAVALMICVKCYGTKKYESMIKVIITKDSILSKK